MESVLYKSIFAEARAEGFAEGRAAALSTFLTRMLIRRLGWVDPGLRKRILASSDADTLQMWCEQVAMTTDDEATRRLLAKIDQTLPA